MNFIFVSPNFPKTYWNWCDRLQKRGVNVLGIGDTPYDNLEPELKRALTEYYYVSNIADYDQMYRGVAYFAFKYGKIDWLESNNEFWLETDAKLRTDFNITTGAQNDFIRNIKFKSAMKASYEKAGVPVARYHMVNENVQDGLDFAKEVGYPVFAKPDNGCGAEATYKINNEDEMRFFYQDHPDAQYIMEEFIKGTIVSFDGIANSECVPIFYTSNYFPTPIFDIVSTQGDLCYWTVKEVPEALRDAGFRTIKAFNAKSRFFHLEFFVLTEDKEGMGKKGDIVALEVNMRPAGGYTPDMINFANSVDSYDIWADMVVYDERRDLDVDRQKYFCAYASRRDHRHYVHTEQEIWDRYGNKIVMAERMPEALVLDMGNQMWTAKLDTYEEMQEYINFIQEEC